MKLSDIKLNDHNPRTIEDRQMKRLVKSIQGFPEMTQLRPIVVDEDNVILGGNMRYLAMKQMGYAETEVVRVSGLTDKQKREFIIKDNVAFGDWDWDVLANEWDADELNDWGLDVPFDTASTTSDEPAVNEMDGVEVAIVAAKSIAGIDRLSQVYSFEQTEMTDEIREKVAKCRIVYLADD